MWLVKAKPNESFSRNLLQSKSKSAIIEAHQGTGQTKNTKGIKKMSYTELNYSVADRVLANIDKTSANNQSKVIHSPWGSFRHYGTRVLAGGKRQRMFAVSGSKVIHNGGGYTFSSLRERISVLAK